MCDYQCTTNIMLFTLLIVTGITSQDELSQLVTVDLHQEPGQHGWYSDCTWAEQSRGQSLSFRRGKIFLFSTSCIVVLGPT
jgi:hypothetical protein